MNEAAPQNSFSVSFHSSVNGGIEFYKDGKPEEIPENLLEGKAAFKVPDMDKFRERFFDKNNRIDLNANVLIEGTLGKTSVLNERELTIRRGGMLLLQAGDLEIAAITGGSDPDECLTLCALNGNIIVNLSQGKIQARLVALRGKIINKTPTFRLDLDGGIAVKEFPPTTFKEGGRIAYDSRSDPSNEEWDKYYRLFISDVPIAVKESH